MHGKREALSVQQNFPPCDIWWLMLECVAVTASSKYKPVSLVSRPCFRADSGTNDYRKMSEVDHVARQLDWQSDRAVSERPLV